MFSKARASCAGLFCHQSAETSTSQTNLDKFYRPPSMNSSSKHHIITILNSKFTYAVLVVIFSWMMFAAAGIKGLSSDDFMRLFLACRWAERPVLFQIAEWPPMYALFYGVPQWLSWDPIKTAHAVTAGVFGWISYTWLSIFDLYSPRLHSLWVATLIMCPLVFYLSASTLSEPLFVALGLTCLYFFLKWRRSEKTEDFYAASAAMMVLTATRLDAWPLSLAYTIYILQKRRDLTALCATALVGWFTCFWMITIAARFGSPWALVNAYSEDVATYHASLWGGNVMAWGFFIKSFPLAFVGLVGGFQRARENPSFRALYAVCLVLVVTQVCLAWNRVPTVYAQRVFALQGVIGTGMALIWLTSRFGRGGAIAGLALQSLFFLLFHGEFKPSYNRSMESIGFAMKNDGLIRTDPPMYIGTDLDPSELPVLALSTGYPLLFRNIYLNASTRQVMLPYPKTPLYFLLKSEWVATVLAKHNPKLSIRPYHGLFWVH